MSEFRDFRFFSSDSKIFFRLDRCGDWSSQFLKIWLFLPGWVWFFAPSTCRLMIRIVKWRGYLNTARWEQRSVLNRAPRHRNSQRKTTSRSTDPGVVRWKSTSVCTDPENKLVKSYGWNNIKKILGKKFYIDNAFEVSERKHPLITCHIAKKTQKKATVRIVVHF